MRAIQGKEEFDSNFYLSNGLLMENLRHLASTT
jgi:hypothetical protein